jgi:phosphatidylglycerophosphatase A
MHALVSFSTLFAASFGGWEVVLILAILLVLFGARHLPELLEGLRRGMEEFIKATREVNEEIHRTMGLPSSPSGPQPDEDGARKDELSLWLAQGFDIGRIPVAPGTFGSLAGVLWFALLLVPGSWWLFVIGTLLGLVASVKYCGDAERILSESDPGSVVLDEIAAIPICFLPWVLLELWRTKSMPPVETFFSGHGLWMSVSIYVLFRVFDIWKPWPVRQSQDLPGGWGVTADDVLAAIYVGAGSLLFVGR